MRVRTVFSFLGAAVLLAGTGPAVTAQQQVARLYVMKVHPGHAMQFEQALAAHVEWRRANGDTWTWSVAQVVAGDDLGLWYIRSGGHQWADIDAYDASEFSRSALEHWLTEVDPHVVSASSMITTADTTNIRWPEDQSAIRFVSLVDFYLRPGQAPKFFEVVNKFHEAIVQHDYPAYYSFNFSVAGGSGDVIRLALPYENWAGMAPQDPPMAAMIAEMYGEEEAQEMNDAFNATLRRVQTTVLMMRPDLSIGSGM